VTNINIYTDKNIICMCKWSLLSMLDFICKNNMKLYKDLFGH